MDIELDKLDVVHNQHKEQFEVHIGDQMAVIKYRLAKGESIFTHTGVPAVFEGQGIAGKMAKVAVEYAKAEGLRIRPLCPYVAAYIKRHKEYQSITVGYEAQSNCR